MIPAKNGGAPGGGSAVLVAGPVRLAVAVLAVPAITPAASAADATASSTRRAARAPGGLARSESH